MSIARAALVIAAGNVASRILGLVRELVIAGLFGATAATDAFRVASRIPISIYDLLIGGMISAALVPVLSTYADRDDQREFWLIASLVTNFLAVVLLCLTAGLMLLAPQLIQLYGPDLDPVSAGQATAMLRITLPAVFFQGLSGVFTALHYARRNFTIPALSISAFNLGIIAMALLLHEQLGIVSLVVGVMSGAVLQAGLQLAALRSFQYRLRLSLAHPALRRILVLYLPVSIGLAVSAFGIAIDTNLATQTGPGNLAALVYATTIVQFPLGLIAAAVSFAILPTLSRQAAPDPATAMPDHAEPLTSIGGVEVADEARFRATLGLGIKLVMLAIVPATIGLVVLRYPVVQLLFERGAFDPAATERTASAFLAYAPGLLAAAIDQVLIFTFYARRNTLTPVLVGVAGVAIFLASALLLIGPLGFVGLALANSVQWTARALLLMVLLWRELGGLRGLRLGRTTLKILVATAVMSAVLVPLASTAGLTSHAPYSTVELVGMTGAIIAISGALHTAALAVLRVEELDDLRRLVQRRLRRTA